MSSLKDVLYVAIMAVLAVSITQVIYTSAGITPW